MSTAHGALEELRDVIGVLREGSPEGAPEPPQPTLAEIPALVDESRRAGMRVRCTLDLTADPALPAAVGRAAYRIVQEGLTNARKHAPGAAVQVTISADEIHRALGPDLLRQLSEKSGIPMAELEQKLAQVLPQAVDKLTPNGTIPT